MLKFIAIATIGLLPFLFSADGASAQGRNVRGDTFRCPHNTCAPSGGQRVKNLSYCKASNCGKGAAK